MRADRLLSILLLLQKHGRLTSASLAKRLEVSERTIHRDMSVLGTAGVPVVADRGAKGGWSLMPGYRASIGTLNESEVRALFVGAPAALLHDLQLDRASGDAALKILSALPDVTRRAAEIAQQRIHIDLSGWKQSRDPVPLLPIVQEAVWSDRKLRFIYGDHAHERTVEPLGLVAKGSIWYVVARIDGDLRTYRVSRIHTASILNEHFDRGEFDLAAYWQTSAMDFKEKLPRYEVVVRTNNLPRLRAMIRWGAIDAVDGDIVHLHFDDEEPAIISLTALGDVVLEPAALREKIVAAAREAITRYAG